MLGAPSVFVTIMAIAAPAMACVCVTGTPKDAFKNASAVFVGEVQSYNGGSASVRVVEVFKGRVGPAVTVFTGPYGESCGYGAFLRANSRHLFYSRESGHAGFVVSTCSRTRPLDSAACDLKLLRNRGRWWSSRFSSFRPAKWLHLFWPTCRPIAPLPLRTSLTKAWLGKGWRIEKRPDLRPAFYVCSLRS